jgi:ferric-dicitrate binding protein FerR (iron transport regulator)
MMLVLDGEASDQESADFAALVNVDPVLRAEWDQLRRVRHTTAELRLRTAPEDLWEDYMNSVYRRVERGIGWILLSVGAIVVLSYGVWRGVQELVGDVTVPWYVKGGVLALLIGIVILAVSVIREKFFVFRDDPYRNVRR